MFIHFYYPYAGLVDVFPLTLCLYPVALVTTSIDLEEGNTPALGGSRVTKGGRIDLGHLILGFIVKVLM